MILAFSTWFLPFVTDLWCWLDVFVVGMSLASVVLTDEPTGIVRIMRALRVLRIFGRLKSLRKIMSALALAIVPVCQVFVILFVLLCIGTLLLSKCPSYFCTCLLGVPPDLMLEACAGAVVGVAVFSSVAPDNFGTFDAVKAAFDSFVQNIPFYGFAALCIDHPEVQAMIPRIAPVSRESVEAYQEIRGRLDALSGRINGEFSDVDWNPFRYVNKNYRRDELAGIYGAARVGLVTPLRDGMNLVAKEFVAAQNPEDPGVLILSRFAGAARQMDQALLVNPNSPEDIADALKRAINMDKAERIRRWSALFENVQREDVAAWRDAFVNALAGVKTPQAAVAC